MESEWSQHNKAKVTKERRANGGRMVESGQGSSDRRMGPIRSDSPDSLNSFAVGILRGRLTPLVATLTIQLAPSERERRKSSHKRSK